MPADHPLLILRREQREDGRHLVVPEPIPYVWPDVIPGMLVAPGPFARHGRHGVLRRAAALARLCHQRFVVLLARS